LRPVVLDQLGVRAALESLAERIETPALEVRMLIDLSFEEGRAEVRLDGEVETAIYRIVQEALTNTRKHAEASIALVEIKEDDQRGELRITIQDDGGGFDPAVESGGFGLNGIRERVELLKGSIEIHSSIEDGTEVGVCLPSGRGAAAPRAV
ncbi:MAG: sensor histidine kinase, partial [Solirubrobacterales bacterium]